MKKITSYRDLYSTIVKQFFVGIYKKGDRFATQRELAEQYQMPKLSIERAVKLLRQDGFILTQGSKGTTVMFDRNNPEHLAKVPFYFMDSCLKEITTFRIPPMILATATIEGLEKSDDVQLMEYIGDITQLVECLQEGRSCRDQAESFLMKIVEASHNRFLTESISLFLEKYICFCLDECVLDEGGVSLRKSAVCFCRTLAEKIKDRDYSGIRELIVKFYGKLYQIPHLIAYGVVKHDTRTFKRQALYTKLLYGIFIEIISNHLQEGDLLPTEKQLCKKYHVSVITVRRAYGILADMKLISRKERIGTKLLATPHDKSMQVWLAKATSVYGAQLFEASETIRIIGEDLFREIVPLLSDSIAVQMQEKLDWQLDLFLKYKAPFLVSDVLVTPVVLSMETGILHESYFHAQQPLSNAAAMCWMANTDMASTQKVYYLMQRAIDSLQKHQYMQFYDAAVNAIQLNSKLLNALCRKQVTKWAGGYEFMNTLGGGEQGMIETRL